MAFLGVTLYRALLPLLDRASGTTAIGLQRVKIHDARVFVLPNPSGRNANFTCAEMLDAFVRLRRWKAQNV